MASRRIALLIGNGAYPREPELVPLAGPANDVRHLAEVLGSPTAGAFDEVKTFVDREHHAIAPELEETLAEAGHDALVLIYYSGHGKLNSRGQLCLATVNTRLSQLHSTSLPLPTLKTLIDESRCRQVLLILDCCFSGAAGKAFLRGTVDDQLLLSAQESSGLHILSSSTALEVSREREHEDGGEVMGNFTRCMVEGMRSGAADLNGDGVVTLSELREYVGRNLRGQSPRYWGIEAGGDPPVARNAGVVRAREEREAAERRRTSVAQKRLTDWLRAGQLPADVYSRALDCLDPPDDGAEPPLERDRLLELIEGPAASPRHVATAFRAIGEAEDTPAEPAPDRPPAAQRSSAPAARASESPRLASGWTSPVIEAEASGAESRHRAEKRPAPPPPQEPEQTEETGPPRGTRPPDGAARPPAESTATKREPAERETPFVGGLRRTGAPGGSTLLRMRLPLVEKRMSSLNRTARLLEKYNRTTVDALPELARYPPAEPAAAGKAPAERESRYDAVTLWVVGLAAAIFLIVVLMGRVSDWNSGYDAGVSSDTSVVAGTDTVPMPAPTTDSAVTTTTDTAAGYAYPVDSVAGTADTTMVP
jgi:uncharacterized caspase-like protein